MKTSHRILASVLIFFGVLSMFLGLYWLGGNDFVRCQELAAATIFGAFFGVFASLTPWLF
jgi:hypothetical protein